MDTTALIPITPDNRLAQAGQAFNQAAAAGVFADYASHKAAHTLRRQRADLKLFAAFLKDAGAPVAGDLQHEPESWRGLTWGLVAGFVRWQLQHGYAVASVNVRLSTVKKYAALAFQAGVIDSTEHTLIREVKGYTFKETNHVNEQRAAADVPTRITRPGAKKADAVSIPVGVVKVLKTQPDTPQGRRDALLMCLLLDHGLRCGEVALLTVGSIDLTAGELRFSRPKVNKEQTHTLSPHTLKAARAYLQGDGAPLMADTPLLRESRKNGQLTGQGMSERAITKRVKTLGKAAGLEHLSAHDCRHSWATRAAKNGTDPFALQEAGGWNSLAMPRRYVEAAKIANEGVVLD